MFLGGQRYNYFKLDANDAEASFLGEPERAAQPQGFGF